jgi:signal transduction histidine kinase
MKRWLPWILLLGTVSLMGAAVYLAFLNRSSGVDEFRLIDFIWGSGWLAFPVVGTVIALRHPENPVGWLASLFALPIALMLFADEYATYATAVSSGDLPFGYFMLWLAQWPFFVAVALIILMFLLFPDGKLPSRRWRFFPYVLVAVAAIGAAASAVGTNTNERAVAENPLFIPEMESISEGLQIFAGNALGVLMVVAVASIFIRFLKAPAEERKQVKWFLYGLGILLGLLLMLFILESVSGAGGVPEPFDTLLFVAAVVAPPIGMAIAILRYRLYDIDLVINKTLVYGALAAFITALYVGVVVGIGSLIGRGQDPNLGLSLVATGLVAVLFQPARERIQRLANRLVYGQRLSPYEAITSFSEQMSHSLDPDVVLPRMADACARATGAERAEVALSLPTGDSRSYVWPPHAPAQDFDISHPVTHLGETLGRISIAKKRGEPPTEQDRDLLLDLASQAGLGLKNLRLTEELRQRLKEIELSRRRIVEAQDTERKRMEKDIHDGAQQQLVAMSVKLGLAQATLAKDPAKTNSLLEDLRAEATETVETLRDLARGIFPQVLADKGLVAALQAHINKMEIPATISSSSLDSSRLPEEVEAAVYFCIREALQNASKHAHGAAIAIDLRMEGPSSLAFEVKDEGPGFDPATVNSSSSGMQNMADRIEAIGGTFEVASAPGRGTTIRGTVPARAMDRVG